MKTDMHRPIWYDVGDSCGIKTQQQDRVAPCDPDQRLNPREASLISSIGFHTSCALCS